MAITHNYYFPAPAGATYNPLTDVYTGITGSENYGPFETRANDGNENTSGGYIYVEPLGAWKNGVGSSPGYRLHITRNGSKGDFASNEYQAAAGLLYNCRNDGRWGSGAKANLPTNGGGFAIWFKGFRTPTTGTYSRILDLITCNTNGNDNDGQNYGPSVTWHDDGTIKLSGGTGANTFYLTGTSNSSQAVVTGPQFPVGYNFAIIVDTDKGGGAGYFRVSYMLDTDIAPTVIYTSPSVMAGNQTLKGFRVGAGINGNGTGTCSFGITAADAFTYGSSGDYAAKYVKDSTLQLYSVQSSPTYIANSSTGTSYGDGINVPIGTAGRIRQIDHRLAFHPFPSGNNNIGAALQFSDGSDIPVTYDVEYFDKARVNGNVRWLGPTLKFTGTRFYADQGVTFQTPDIQINLNGCLWDQYKPVTQSWTKLGGYTNIYYCTDVAAATSGSDRLVSSYRLGPSTVDASSGTMSGRNYFRHYFIGSGGIDNTTKHGQAGASEATCLAAVDAQEGSCYIPTDGSRVYVNLHTVAGMKDPNNLGSIGWTVWRGACLADDYFRGTGIDFNGDARRSRIYGGKVSASCIFWATNVSVTAGKTPGNYAISDAVDQQFACHDLQAEGGGRHVYGATDNGSTASDYGQRKNAWNVTVSGSTDGDTTAFVNYTDGSKSNGNGIQVMYVDCKDVGTINPGGGTTVTAGGSGASSHYAHGPGGTANGITKLVLRRFYGVGNTASAYSSLSIAEDVISADGGPTTGASPATTDCRMTRCRRVGDTSLTQGVSIAVTGTGGAKYQFTDMLIAPSQANPITSVAMTRTTVVGSAGSNNTDGYFKATGTNAVTASLTDVAVVDAASGTIQPLLGCIVNGTDTVTMTGGLVFIGSSSNAVVSTCSSTARTSPTARTLSAAQGLSPTMFTPAQVKDAQSGYVSTIGSLRVTSDPATSNNLTPTSASALYQAGVQNTAGRDITGSYYAPRSSVGAKEAAASVVRSGTTIITIPIGL